MRAFCRRVSRPKIRALSADVISLGSLRDYERLPVHEDGLRAEKLDILTATTTNPSSAFTYFISQNWETFGDAPHPDNNRNTKISWLKNLPTHMKLPTSIDEVWVWWDCKFGAV